MTKTHRRLGDINQGLVCPQCDRKFYWGLEREIHTTIRGSVEHPGDLPENDRIIKDTMRFRRVCNNCGYKGVWQYGLPYFVKRKKED